MAFPKSILLLTILGCCSGVAPAQGKKAPVLSESPPPNFALPASGYAILDQAPDSTVGGGEDLGLIFKALVEHVEPVSIAADVLKCPAEKIVLVPHIFWREQKWLDWAEQANQARGVKPTAGPDDKIYLSVEAVYEGNGTVTVELGPFREELAKKIAERIAVKMVREAPDFSRNFFRQRQTQGFQELSNRIHNIDDELVNWRKELHQDAGLSQAQLSDQITDLQRQLLSTDLSLHVMKARETAIREQFGEIKKQAETKTPGNEAMSTLKRIVELRKARFDRLKTAKSTGATSQEEVDKAEEEMLAAQVDLDRAAAALQKSESQSQLDSLTAELRKLAIDRAEAESRINYLQKATHESMNDLASRRENDRSDERLQAKLKNLEKHRAELQQDLNRAEDVLNKPVETLQLSLRN